MSGDPARRALDAAVLAWIAEADWRPDEARFDALAREAFAHQFTHCAPYRGLCTRQGVTPDDIDTWRDIPSVPTGAFKELPLTSFPDAERVHVFRTSGTSTERRGELHLDTLELYEASLLPSFRRHLLPDLEPAARMRMEVLAPPADEAPDSSLSHMFEVVLRALGTPDSSFAFRQGHLDMTALVSRLRGDCERQAPVLLCGTAFSFVHLLDHLASRGTQLALPAGTRIMETGGFKGRSRELTRETLHAEIATALGVPAGRIVNQYGMTELASQFYDSALVDDGPRRKLGPPWARTQIVDPATGLERRAGEIGSIRILDLANTGSLCSIQTADLGRAIGDGFEVLGREPGAEARGCSIAADALLTGAVGA